ncbi:ACT domain-containing protein, partial [Escherichia coli]|nr:ACT domain-containing protein [Escherichia coli]
TVNGIKTISGTVFADDVQRVIELDGFAIDVDPKGKMIVMKNKDIPGVIGTVGKLLGDNKINIADFRLSRGKDGIALAIASIDEKVTSEIIKN